MIQQILDKYGLDEMKEVWIEELLELATKLQRSKRHEVIDSAIITEIADVDFCIDQMKHIFGKDECNVEKQYKMNRTKQRLL